MKISLVIALLCAPVSQAAKLQETNEDSWTKPWTKELAQEETEFPKMPPGEAIYSMGIKALHDLGDELRKQKRTIESAVRSNEHMLIHVAREAGVTLKEDQLLDPNFVANMISAEYDSMVKQMSDERAKKYAVRDIDGFFGNLERTAKHMGLAEEESTELVEESKGCHCGGGRGPSGPGDRYTRPADYCDPRHVQCQLLKSMPPPEEVYRHWIRAMSNASKDLQRFAKDELARDIDGFNQMLLREAKRIGVAPPKHMPDPKALAHTVEALVNKVLMLGIREKEGAIRAIAQVELGIAGQLGGAYTGIAMTAQRYGAKVNPHQMPRGNHELMEIAKGMLTAAKKYNKSGHLSHLHREVVNLAKRSGIKQSPSEKDVQELMDGLFSLSQAMIVGPRAYQELQNAEKMGKHEFQKDLKYVESRHRK